jgi:YVTN family beta-propeller protein
MNFGVASAAPGSSRNGKRAANGSNTATCIFAAVVAACIWGSPRCEGQIEADGYIAGSNGISVINTVTNTAVSSIPVGSFGGAVTPDGKSAYVSNLSGTVSVINAATNTVLGPAIDLGGFPSGIAVTPDANLAYVGTTIIHPVDVVTGAISVINTANNKIVGTPIEMGDVPAGIAITPDGKFAYVGANSIFILTPTNATVLVINTTTNAVVDSNFGRYDRGCGRPRANTKRQVRLRRY